MNLDPPVTEKMVAAMLMRERYRRHSCIPNYTPGDWWENDVFMLTSSGYWWEFEIKLSRADFKKDAEKSRDVRGTGRWEEIDGRRRHVYDQQNKHQILAEDMQKGPTHFYYVTPINLITLDMLPSWAGLIEFEQSGKRLYERPKVRAPKRNGVKRDDWRASIFETCYWRYHQR